VPRIPTDQCSRHDRSRRGRSSQAVAAPALPHQRHGDSGTDDKPSPSRLYLSGPDICRRYGVSDMTLWRWLRDALLAFPQPAMRVKDRRYWLETDLVNWERAQQPDMRSRPTVIPVEKVFAKAPRRRKATP
jgi:predicted DNA-binding transcriptional regulator AlpA